MKQSKEIMDRVIKSYRLMLGFYGADLDNEETGQLRRARNFKSRFENLNRFSHNYLRITRILKFLGEVGLEKLKLQFLTFFIQEVLVNRLIPNCLISLERFWMPTLREDADLEACIRFLREPTGTPPVSVLLPPQPAAAAVNPATGAAAPSDPPARDEASPSPKEEDLARLSIERAALPNEQSAIAAAGQADDDAADPGPPSPSESPAAAAAATAAEADADAAPAGGGGAIAEGSAATDARPQEPAVKAVKAAEAAESAEAAVEAEAAMEAEAAAAAGPEAMATD